MFFNLIKKKIIHTDYSIEEKQKAKVKSLEDYADALHIIIAEREKADYIITRNTKHFNTIGSLIPIMTPEKLLEFHSNIN